MSALTLTELERWLTFAVAGYHGSIHGSLNQTPAGRWDEGVREFGAQPVVAHPAAFLVDFLPVIRRRITRTGFVIDHVHYFANVLKPWIARRDRQEKFIIRPQDRADPASTTTATRITATTAQPRHGAHRTTLAYLSSRAGTPYSGVPRWKPHSEEYRLLNQRSLRVSSPDRGGAVDMADVRTQGGPERAVQRVGLRSMMVAASPRSRAVEAISQPMNPPPMTATCLARAWPGRWRDYFAMLVA